MLLNILTAALVVATTPYSPTSGWTYYLEGARGVWPKCSSRFLSSDRRDTKMNLATSVSSSTEITLEPAKTAGNFYLKLGNGKFVSYTNTCTSLQVDQFTSAGSNQEFRLRGENNQTTGFAQAWKLEAVARGACEDTKFVTFPHSCGSDDVPKMGAEDGADFFLHAVRNNGARQNKNAASQSGCADPFAWYSTGAQSYLLACTGGNLDLFHSKTISATSSFRQEGSVLGGHTPSWCQSGNRWAPENLEFTAKTTANQTSAGSAGKRNVVFFSDSTGRDGKHRVGWAMSSSSTASAGSWNEYSSTYLNLGDTAAGEIDQHIFQDSDGKTYLLWKTDDNSVGSKTTRLWGQEVGLSSDKVTLIGQRKELMDSSGLWWVTSFIDGGSLAEGPELIHHGEYYYLFFAAGKYCTDTYSEGVARSKSIWGPYEKMQTPLLSTGMVGYSDNHKQIGPGHASFVSTNGKYYAIYHASKGNNCDRYAFVEEMVFDAKSGWPYISF